MGVGSSRDGLFDSITRRPDCCREAHCGSVCSRPPAPPPDFSLLTFSTFAPSGSDTELKVLLVSLLLLCFLRLCAPCCSISALASLLFTGWLVRLLESEDLINLCDWRFYWLVAGHLPAAVSYAGSLNGCLPTCWLVYWCSERMSN